MPYLDADWTNLTAVKNDQKLKNFGLLEKPSFPPPYSQYSQCSFKIALIGSSFCGKTTFLESLFKARPTSLLSETHPNQNYIETPGVQINHFYWPTQIFNSNFMIFDLSIWDIGKSSTLKYDYIKPSYDANLDCRLYIFSWKDKQSFLEVYDQIKRIYFSTFSDQKKLPMLVIGTKFDDIYKSEIEIGLVNELENLIRKKVIRYSSLNVSFEQIASFMNLLCETLYRKN